MRLAALALVVAAAATAHADPGPMSAGARAHLERGNAHYELGDYTQAILEFEAGQKADPNPYFHYALAQAYRRQGDCAHAAEQYLAFLETHPAQADAIRARANLTRCPQKVTATRSTEPVEPVEPQVVPPPPVHHEVVHAPEQPPPPQPPAGPHFYADIPGDVLAASGAIGLGVGITYFVLGDRDARGANAATTLARRQSFADKSDRERTIGTFSTIAGGALAVGAVVRYVLVARRTPEPIVSVTVTPTSVMAGWSW